VLFILFVYFGLILRCDSRRVRNDLKYLNEN